MNVITVWTKTKEFFKEHWLTIVFGVVIIILIILLCRSCTSYKNMKDIADNNIVALTDSVEYYKAKNGDIVAEKTLLIGDMETLQLAYEDLYNQLKNMKVKDPDAAVKIETVTDNGQHDTTWIVQHDLDTCLQKEFNFDNEYRVLNGTVSLDNDTLGLNIANDKVYADFTVAIKDNKVYVSSTNPYVDCTNMEGITVPKYKPTWSLTVGPSISAGYDPWHKTFSPTIGVSLVFGYSIVSGGKRLK